MTSKPAGAGKSSIDLVDWNKTVQLINLKDGCHFLDLACGFGHYSIAFADQIGRKGKISAVDLWAEGLMQLQGQAQGRNISWIETHLADISDRIPVPDASVDVGLLATALHDIPEASRSAVVKEIYRVLKPDGVLNIIEFKKELSGPPGPPAHVRIGPEDIEALVAPLGFATGTSAQIGPCVYLCQFCKPV